MIGSVTPGGLDAFKRLDQLEKERYRKLAIDDIRGDCIDTGRAAVVAGHFMFWEDKKQEAGEKVCIQDDIETYTHIIYLDVPAKEVAQRREADVKRNRPWVSVDHLEKWQREEKRQIRQLCRENGILYLAVSPHATPPAKIAMLLHDFQLHTEEHNLSCAKKRLDEILGAGQDQLRTMLVIDADRTLAAEDAGVLFFEKIPKSLGSTAQDCTLKALFSGPLGQTYTGFRQATLLFEETADDENYTKLCKWVASEVTTYPDFVALLHLVAQHDHVGALVVSCGLRLVWEMVLEREGLSETVKVIAGGRIADDFVVTAAVKGALVTHLQATHNKRVVAFGDSPLDLEMLSKADDAIVVVGREESRSKTMDVALTEAINNGRLKARQVLLPRDVSQRLHAAKLPLVQLTENDFVNFVFGRPTHRAGLQAFLATEKGAGKLLATSTRDAAVAGPALKEAHRRVGRYLATEYLTDLIGLEECPIQHVLNKSVNGYRLWHEKQTTIVALMRGGEPMASGVNDAFPLAMFVHANHPDNVKPHHLQGQLTVLLVDSVVNKGNTVVDFMKHVRKLHATIRIVVVAGVVQEKAIGKGILPAESGSGSILVQAPSHHRTLSIVALRTSSTEFVGSGTTDTGNRLFNTTHLLK